MTQSVEYVIYGVASEKNLADWLAIIIPPLIALIAVAFTAVQMNLQKRHNRLMVTPNLDGMIIENLQNPSYSYVITNTGVGPAILKASTILVDGIEITTDEPFPTAIKIILPNVPESDYGHESLSPGSYIPAGKSVRVIFIQVQTVDILKNVRPEISNRAQLLLEYESIYGDKFHFDSSV